MFKRLKASPATRNASAAGGSASEKKRKKKKTDNQKLYNSIGYAVSIAFILVSVGATTGAFSNINAASLIYNTRLAQMQAEEQKAKDALEDELGININDDGTIDKDNTSDSNPIDTGNLGDGNFYMDDDGNIIYIDKDGNKIIYHICPVCSHCGHVIEDNGDTYNCKCGSDFYKYTVYQVKKGDTLSQISGEVGASVNSIANLNEIENVHLIYEGESLRIPK